MTGTYVVGFDGSDAAASALGFTRSLADATGAEVLAADVFSEPLSVVTPYGPAVMPLVAVELEKVQEQETEDVLRRAGADVDSRALRGVSAPAELHALAQAKGAALIALGATHRGALGRLLPGSVGERTVHGAPCPVLVVPEGRADRQVGRIGVAYQDHGEAPRALRVAEELAMRTDASLVLITAIDGGRGAVDNTMLLRAAAKLRDRGLDVETRIVVTPAGPAITAECHDLDLLVAGSRGYGPVRSVMLGATARHLVDHAPCPVLVVPRGAATAPLTTGLRSATTSRKERA